MSVRDDTSRHRGAGTPAQRRRGLILLAVVLGAAVVVWLVYSKQQRSFGWQRLESLKAVSDEGYLYLLLQTGGSDGPPEWRRVVYRIAIDTYAADRGERSLPAPHPAALPTGAEFLIEIGGPEASHLQVTPAYNPYPTMGRIEEGAPIESPLEASGRFVPLRFEANRERFARGGERFPAQYVDRGRLRFGSLDPESPSFDTRTDIAIGNSTGAIEIRIPWGLLNVADPSSRRVLHGMSRSEGSDTIETEGFRIYAFAFDPKRPDKVIDQLPPRGRRAKLFTWEPWEEPQYRLQPKRGTPLIEEAMKQLPHHPDAAPAGSSVAEVP